MASLTFHKGRTHGSLGGCVYPASAVSAHGQIGVPIICHTAAQWYLHGPRHAQQKMHAWWSANRLVLPGPSRHGPRPILTDLLCMSTHLVRPLSTPHSCVLSLKLSRCCLCNSRTTAPAVAFRPISNQCSRSPSHQHRVTQIFENKLERDSDVHSSAGNERRFPSSAGPALPCLCFVSSLHCDVLTQRCPSVTTSKCELSSGCVVRL